MKTVNNTIKPDYKVKKCYSLFILISLLALFFLLSNQAYGQARESSDGISNNQKKKGKFDADRMRYGGSFGATFGSVTYVDIAPTVGYMLTNNWLFGLSGRYIYYKEKLYTYQYETNIYGGGPFSEYFILENITLHAEYELLNMDDRFKPERRINVSSVLVGGGYRMMLGRNSFVNLLLLFNLNDNENSIYTNPIIRISFGLGL